MKIELRPEELKERIDFLKKKRNRFRVYYGFAKLTKKVVRKRELAVYFENGSGYRNTKYVHQKIFVVYERFQTWEEMTDWDIGNRIFTKYGYFIDDNYWKSDIERVLEDNFLADENHISKKEREIIREKLREAYYDFYKIEKKPIGQQSLIFE